MIEVISTIKITKITNKSYFTYLVFFIKLKTIKLAKKKRDKSKIDNFMESVIATANPKIKVPQTMASFSVTSKKLK